VNRPEQIAHKAIADHLRQRGVPGLVWWHTPNNLFAGGKHNRKGVAIQASIMKGLGMKPGVPDFLLVRDGKIFALELKAERGGRLSAAQCEFIAALEDAGGFCCVAEGLDRGLRVLETWGLLKGRAQR
jgi:hypothetical protein